MKEYTEYELIFIIPLEKSEKTEEIKEKVKSIVEKATGTIKKTSEPQKRKLAYPIKNVKNGVYIISRLTLPKDQIAEVERQIQLEEDVLRHLLVKTDELPEGSKTKETARKEEVLQEEPVVETPQKEEKPAPREEEKEETEEKPKEEKTEIAKEKEEEEKEETEEKESEKKLKFEELDKKLDDILKDDLI